MSAASCSLSNGLEFIFLKLFLPGCLCTQTQIARWGFFSRREGGDAIEELVGAGGELVEAEIWWLELRTRLDSKDAACLT